MCALANLASAGGSWASDDRVAYDGESEVIFTYIGPEGVSVRVYEDGALLGSIDAGTSKRRIVVDGSHTFEARSGVYDAANKRTVEDATTSKKLTVNSRKNRSSVIIIIEKSGSANIVRELNLTNAAAIQTQPKPVEDAPPAQTAAPAAPPPGSAYYVSASGDDGNDGLTEAAAFKTLRHAVFAVGISETIKTITVIGTLSQASEGEGGGSVVFFCMIIGDAPILITGLPNAPFGRRAVLSASGARKGCVTVSSMSKIAVRFEHIEISGGAGAGLDVGLNAVVTLGPGSVVRNNQGGGVVVSSPRNEYRDRYNPGHLILDGGIIENNKREHSGGGILVRGAFTMKRGGVRNNTAALDKDGVGFGGGVYIRSGDPVSIEGGDITGNTAGMGGGVFIDGGDVAMTGGTVSGNTATQGGGGVIVWNGATFNQRGGSISGNRAPSDTRAETYNLYRMPGSFGTSSVR